MCDCDSHSLVVVVGSGSACGSSVVIEQVPRGVDSIAVPLCKFGEE